MFFMGLDLVISVIDVWGCVYDYENLFMVGIGVMFMVGICNVMLIVMVLVLCMVDKIIEESCYV